MRCRCTGGCVLQGVCVLQCVCVCVCVLQQACAILTHSAVPPQVPLMLGIDRLNAKYIPTLTRLFALPQVRSYLRRHSLLPQWAHSCVRIPSQLSPQLRAARLHHPEGPPLCLEPIQSNRGVLPLRVAVLDGYPVGPLRSRQPR